MDIRRPVEGKLSIELINNLIPLLDEADEQYHIEQYHNDYSGISWAEYRKRGLLRAKEFIELGQTVTEDIGGIHINNQFFISNKKNKWKNIEGYKWYRFSNPNKFTEKYVKPVDTL